MGVETLLIASILTTAVGTGVAAYGQYQTGKATQALNNYNAQVNEQAALDAQNQGRVLANEQRRKNQSIQARQRALYAKAGVVSATGSPLLVQVQQAGELELGALEVEQQANTQAARLRQEAVLDRMSGKIARRSGNIGATASILQGASSIANTGVNYAMYRGKT